VDHSSATTNTIPLWNSRTSRVNGLQTELEVISTNPIPIGRSCYTEKNQH